MECIYIAQFRHKAVQRDLQRQWHIKLLKTKVREHFIISLQIINPNKKVWFCICFICLTVESLQV